MTYIRPFQEDGLLWLRATAAYELHDSPIISDGEWDELTRKLRDNYDALDPYLKEAIPQSCLISSTGSGVDWKSGLPLLAAEKQKEEK
jgi:hypothetical protein